MKANRTLNSPVIPSSHGKEKRLLRCLIHVLGVFRVMATATSISVVLGSSLAYAWGIEGHQVVAGLALAQLTPKAKAEVDRLLALEPGETLVSISTWADEHKNPSTARWHFVNFPRDSCTFNAERDCADGQCLIAAIDKQTAVLASNAPDEKRLSALKYLTHLVGDVYQPLHAGYFDDKGGNKYQVQFFKRGTNLHSLWDSGIIKNMNEEADAMTARLMQRKIPFSTQKWGAVQAAEQSCQIVATAGFYPERKVGQDYLDRFVPVLEQQLSTAGAALAGLLNRTLR